MSRLSKTLCFAIDKYVILEVYAFIAQLAECVIGNDEVTGSTPVGSSKNCKSGQLYISKVVFFLHYNKCVAKDVYLWYNYYVNSSVLHFIKIIILGGYAVCMSIALFRWRPKIYRLQLKKSKKKYHILCRWGGNLKVE